MAWYEGTYCCGHEGRVNIIGRVADRQWKADRHFEKLCPECWEAEKQRQFDETNKKAAAEAAEMDLPELSGTEKQIAWANTLRQQWIEKAEKYIERQNDELKMHKERFPARLEEISEAERAIGVMGEALDDILMREAESRYWIDGRYDDPACALSKEVKKIIKEQDAPIVPQALKDGAIEEMTIRPSGEPAVRLVTEIRIKDDTVIALLPEKNEEFRLLLRDLRFSWESGRWQRETGLLTGSPLDRAAELGIKLLAAGFPIRVYSEDLHKQILAGKFEPECFRWILLHKEGFRVRWNRKTEDFYEEARRLPGSRWLSEYRSVYVPKEAFREIQDFAEKYEFRLTANAQKQIEDAQLAFESAMVADVTVQKEEHLPQPGERPVLDPEDVSGDIDEGLRDEN